MPPTAGAQAVSVLPNDPLSRYAFGFAFVSAAAAMVSIAVSHTCLAIAIVLLLFSKTRLQLPAIVWPFAGFLAWTALSAAFSGEPAAALPQFKKFFVFTALVVVFSLFRTMDQARRLAEAWFACAAAAALWSIVQFVQKWAAARRAGVDFLAAYVPDRITGFFSHWETFSQALLLIFLLLVSYRLFSESGRRNAGVWTGCGVVCGVALGLAFTRSVWIGLLVAGSYLIWQWRRKLLWALPVALAIAFVVAPGAARQRLESIVHDPQQPRFIMWRTGVRMIEAHPWFGVGPERVGPLFSEFVPADVETLPDAYYGHLHSIYVHYAAERGLPAVLFLLWSFGQILWDHTRALQRLSSSRRDDRRFLLHAVVAATVAMMVIGGFDVTLGDSEVLGIYLALVALGYRAVEIGREQESVRLA
jgi:putative inorganic carbon (hco3(-)) transporter